MVTAVERGPYSRPDGDVALRVLAALITIPILRRLAGIEYLIRAGDQAEMTKFEDLQAADAELAATVQDLVGSVQTLTDGVTTLDEAFDALKAAVDQGNDAAIQAEIDRVQAAVSALKDAKASVDASTSRIDEDFPAGGEPHEPPTTGDDDGSGTDDGSVPPGVVGA